MYLFLYGSKFCNSLRMSNHPFSNIQTSFYSVHMITSITHAGLEKLYLPTLNPVTIGAFSVVADN